MPPALLDALEINPSREPQACVIWLHGLGADGHDFEPLIPQLGVVEVLAVRVLLPHAPQRPVTINGGMRMRAWYDILAPDFRAVEDSQGIRQSGRQLAELVAREEAGGIPSERILLAGFSQGGAIALHTGLRYPRRLAGILALSTWLPLAATLASESTEANLTVPILMAHGMHDTVVPPALAEQSRDTLRQAGYTVDWRTYPMPHAVCPEEVQAISSWLHTVLGTVAG
jgi:phospholipase/carboxylesterase